MTAVAGLVDIPGWFVVLPDCASSVPLAASLRGPETQEISHPSGRPWLLGCWPYDAVAVGEEGLVKVAVVGQHALGPAQLAEYASRTAAVADLDGLAASLVGSAHLVASVAGQVRVQGTVTGLRRVFNARIGGISVAADRSDVLASLLDASVDEQRLAVHLLDSPTLYPLTGQPVWRGVSVLPNDHYLVLEGDGRHRWVKWWSPPQPVMAMSVGAAALESALAAAVEVRLRGRELVSCDLGGLDSTSLCSLGAASEAKVIAYTADGLDPIGEDVGWAQRTVAALGNVEHHVIAGDRLPKVYEGILDTVDRLDEPCAATVCRDRWLIIARSAAARGSRLHLSGFGGDELLAGSPAHLCTVLRTHPGTALRNARGFAIQRRWPYRETLRQLLDDRPYRTWLLRVPDDLTGTPPPLETPSMDWGRPPRLPPWARPDAVDAVRELIRAEAPTVEALAQQRGLHVELEAMRANSRMVRQLGQMTARLGLALAAPYFDDRVLEAGLAVRPQDRVTPWQYKPLIVEAMRGIVPEESLTRRTKDEGSYEVEAGMREHRADLLALCEDSRLARLGLIDANALREVCSRPLPPSLQFDALYQTVACEVWLRTLDGAVISS